MEFEVRCGNDKSLINADGADNVFTYFSKDCASSFKAIKQSVIVRSNSLKEYISTQVVYFALMITSSRFYN